jgi:hypothetical protein
MSIIVLYTFDFKAKHTDALTMLECSIITVKRELGNNAKIYLYTTTPKELQFLSYLNIEIKHYNPVEYNQPIHTKVNKLSYISDYDSISHYNVIGHSRLYIIKYLLENEKKPVLYMDNDTGITHSHGPNIIQLSKELTYPMGYCIESWVKIYNFIIFFKNKSYTHNGINLNGEMNTVNNGIQLFPYTPESITTANKIISFYEYLIALHHTPYSDMFAFSAVWFSLPVRNVFINPNSQHYKLTKTLPDAIHYYYDKYFNMPPPIDKIKNYIEMYKACIIKNDTLLLPDDTIKSKYALNILYKYYPQHFERYPDLVTFKFL